MKQVTRKTFVWILRSFSSPCFQTVSNRECYNIGGWKDELAQWVAESLMVHYLWNPSRRLVPQKCPYPEVQANMRPSVPSETRLISLFWHLSSLLYPNLQLPCLLALTFSSATPKSLVLPQKDNHIIWNRKLMQFCFTLTFYLPQPLISSPSLFLCLPSGCSSFIFSWRGSCHLGQKTFL